VRAVLVLGRLVVSVPAMHEQVERRTEEEQQVRQRTEDVDAVLTPQEEERNGEESQKPQPEWQAIEVSSWP
jgi:hypothetical protein